MGIIPRVHDLYHGNTVNFAELAGPGGIWGVILKATQGTGSTDQAYALRSVAALKAGLLLGAYDFSTGDDVAANVARFMKVVNPAPGTAMGLDFEDLTHNAMSADQAYEFLDRLAQALGRAPFIYGGNRIREHIDHQQAKWVDMAKWVRLWQCRYIGGQPADNAALFAAIKPIPPWTSNWMIQYAADGDGPQPHTVPGAEKNADLNAVLFDTKEALAAAWAGEPRRGVITAPVATAKAAAPFLSGADTVIIETTIRAAVNATGYGSMVPDSAVVTMATDITSALNDAHKAPSV